MGENWEIYNSILQRRRGRHLCKHCDGSCFCCELLTVTASADAPLLFGSLQIDPQRRLVWRSGQAVELTPMEFDILLLLARRPGQVFSARQIYEAVAADTYDASWTGISSMVYKLRRKLGAGIIETVRGHGYRFTPK